MYFSEYRVIEDRPATMILYISMFHQLPILGAVLAVLVRLIFARTFETALMVLGTHSSLRTCYLSPVSPSISSIPGTKASCDHWLVVLQTLVWRAFTLNSDASHELNKFRLSGRWPQTLEKLQLQYGKCDPEKGLIE